MASAAMKVPCPECEAPVEVPIVTTSSTTSEGGLLVLMAPQMGPFAEHYATEHAVQ